MFAVMVRVLVVLWCLISGQALAGAWPREAGTGFVSSALSLSWPQEIATWDNLTPTGDYASLYLEYGLTEQLTLGLDLGHTSQGAGKTVVFVQHPLNTTNASTKIALQLGLGQISGALSVRPGVLVGRGLPNGWFALESFAEIQISERRMDYKIDVTRGWTLPKSRKFILQLQSGVPARQDSYSKLAPSLVVPIKPRTHLELGMSWGLVGDRSMGLKLGMWHEF